MTFAGVLPYVDRAATAHELRRVCRSEAIVVPYDFKIRLEDVWAALGIDPPAPPDYDHAATLPGVDGFMERTVGRDTADLTVTADALAHLLLATPSYHECLTRTLDAADPFPDLKKRLTATNTPRSVEARLYCTVYRRVAS